MKFLKYSLLFLFLSFSVSAYSQLDSTKYKIESSVLYSNKDKLPLWLYANSNGIIPSESSFILNASVFKNYTKTLDNFWDYAFGLQIGGSNKYNKKLELNELFLSTRLSQFEFKIGMQNEPIEYDGLSMVNKSIIWSGNSRMYPRLSFSSLGYLKVPLSGDLLYVKGLISEGRLLDDRYVDDVRMHYKNAYLRIGKAYGFSFELGVEHYAFWGGNHPTKGELPHSFKDFLRIMVAKEGGGKIENINALGNHIGQNQIKFNYNSNDFEASFYMRNMFEDSSQYFLKLFYKSIRDIKDINYGLYFKLKKESLVKSFLIEYYSTMNQGHAISDDGSFILGYDSNFNHGLYGSGWSYYGRGMGITLNSPTKILDNKRVIFENTAFRSINFGIRGEFSKNIHYKFKATYHMNYGSVYPKYQGKSTDDYPSDIRLYTKKRENQTYCLFELYFPQEKLPFDISASIGLDAGDIHNASGFMIKLSKTGFFK